MTWVHGRNGRIGERNRARNLDAPGRGARTRTTRWSARAPLMACLFVAVAALSACQQQPTDMWETLGPRDGSTVLAMIRDPKVPQLVYASTSGGQVYRTRIESRSVSGGQGIPDDATVVALAADPRVGGLVYAGTSHGMYVTNDFGDTWHARGMGLPTDDTVQSLALIAEPGGATLLYSGTEQHGVYISRDAAATWTPASVGLPPQADVYAMAYNQATSTVFAGLVNGAGIYALSAGSSAWVARGEGLRAKGDIFTVLPVNQASGAGTLDTVYAGTSRGVFASADSGQTWHAAGLASSRVLSLAADPSSALAVYAGTDDTVYRSVDGGQHWTAVGPAIAHAVSAIVVTTDTHHQPVVFAGAPGVLRYPALPGAQSGPLGLIVTIMLFAVLLGFIYFYGRRNLKYLQSRYPTPGAPDARRRLERGQLGDDATGNVAHNGHVSPRQPTPPD